jgi:hypothetical protein
MSDQALIGVYGPVADVEAAIVKVPGVTSTGRNRIGSLVVGLGPSTEIVVGEDVDTTDVIVQGDSPDVVASWLVEQLADALTFRVVGWSVTDELLADRPKQVP